MIETIEFNDNFLTASIILAACHIIKKLPRSVPDSTNNRLRHVSMGIHHGLSKGSNARNPAQVLLRQVRDQRVSLLKAAAAPGGNAFCSALR